MLKKTTIRVLVSVVSAFIAVIRFSLITIVLSATYQPTIYTHFRGVADPQTNNVTGATLLENFIILDVDDKTYQIHSIKISAQSPTYSPKDFPTEKCFQHTKLRTASPCNI